MGKVISIVNQKGGVGKTTNLLNLAGIFEQLEKRVLIMDLDLYSGGIATYLNKKGDKNIFHMVFDIENGTYKNFHDYTTRIDNYIDIISAPIDPRDANKIDAKYLNFVIEEAKTKYDVVLIDTNHSLNDINLTILDTVDKITFFTTGDPLDLKNIRSLLSIFDNLNYGNYKILLNNSRDPFKTYFSFFEIRKIINHHIDYTLSAEMFLKDMDKIVMRGAILSLDKKFADVMSDDYHTFVTMATDLLEGKN